MEQVISFLRFTTLIRFKNAEFLNTDERTRKKHSPGPGLLKTANI
jgi:hypothetical protein